MEGEQTRSEYSECYYNRRLSCSALKNKSVHKEALALEHHPPRRNKPGWWQLILIGSANPFNIVIHKSCFQKYTRLNRGACELRERLLQIGVAGHSLSSPRWDSCMLRPWSLRIYRHASFQHKQKLGQRLRYCVLSSSFSPFSNKKLPEPKRERMARTGWHRRPACSPNLRDIL